MSSILVVDDEAIVREVVVSYLQREGYQTLEAGDGDAARELIERDRPALVILDVMLPGTDGFELCRWVRARSDLPVILLTARGEETDRIVGLELGADDYVTKPFSPRELAARVPSSAGPSPGYPRGSGWCSRTSRSTPGRARFTEGGGWCRMRAICVRSSRAISS